MSSSDGLSIISAQQKILGRANDGQAARLQVRASFIDYLKCSAGPFVVEEFPFCIRAGNAMMIGAVTLAEIAFGAFAWSSHVLSFLIILDVRGKGRG